MIMPAQRAEPARAAERGSEESHARESQPAAAAAAPLPETPGQGGAWKAWLPLTAALVIMPLLAYAVTTFVLVPRMQKALRLSGLAAAEPGKAGPGETAGSGSETPVRTGQRQSVALSKLLVNVAGTMGSRYLLASIALAGDGADFPKLITQNEAQLRDVACGLLSTKTIADLEKPGARNTIRGELLAGFNNILGASAVQEIYFTEFAIQ
jgi:flagellar FliL protein